MIYLHKVLPLIVSPLFLILMICVIAAIFESRKIMITAIITLSIFSMQFLSNHLVKFLEKNYERLYASDLVPDNSAAIVVLSGMLVPVSTKTGLIYEWADSSDRFFAGINLMKNNKAPLLIFTRGYLPWSVGQPEGEYLAALAKQYDINEKQILLTENVETTDQEAKAISELFGTNKTKIILVTSAFHMPRAQMVFEAAGLEVLPFPVDFRSVPNKITIMDFIPSADGFYNTSFFVREMIGRLYYKLKYR